MQKIHIRNYLLLPFWLLAAGIIYMPAASIVESEDNPVFMSSALAPEVRQISDTLATAGFSRDSEKSELRALKGTRWKDGIAAFHESNMKLAAENFCALLKENTDLLSSDRAAVAFWAYRAFHAEDDEDSAARYLDRAARENPGFYSMLARKLKGEDIISSDMQLSMALEYASSRETITAYYPMPKWTPASGYKIEPALLFAIMRQESRFDPDAESESGARGVMQLMPATAHAVAHSIKLKGSILEPSISMALGQQYIENLMQMNSIQNNMIYILAAYNAGPGMLEKWQRSVSYNNDPLLFIESMPYGTTRDYVINVIGNYWVYSQLFGGDDSSLAMLSHNEWPLYEGSAKQFAIAKNFTNVN